jgi:hypothetical protein
MKFTAFHLMSYPNLPQDFTSISRFITQKLKLKVNEAKRWRDRYSGSFLGSALQSVQRSSALSDPRP